MSGDIQIGGGSTIYTNHSRHSPHSDLRHYRLTYSTSRLTFGQHDATHFLSRLHLEFEACAAAAVAPTPPPTFLSHVDDTLALSWLPQQFPFLPCFARQGVSRGLVVHPHKSSLTPSVSPTVYVGKLIDTANRTVRHPESNVAGLLATIHAIIGTKRCISLWDVQRLCGHLVWATAHTRYFRSPLLATLWRAVYRSPSRPPRPYIALTRPVRDAIARCAAAALIPLRGQSVTVEDIPPNLRALWAPHRVIVTDAQMAEQPGTHGAGAVAVLRPECFKAAACQCSNQSTGRCRVHMVVVPIRYSSSQAHAEMYTYVRAYALAPVAPSAHRAFLVYSDATANRGLAKQKVPTKSSRALQLCSRVSTLLSRNAADCTVFAWAKCPGGDFNPVDAACRAFLKQLTLAAVAQYSQPPTTTVFNLIHKAQLSI